MAVSTISFNKILRYKNDTGSAMNISIPISGRHSYFVVVMPISSTGATGTPILGQVSCGGSWSDYPISIEDSLSTYLTNPNKNGWTLTLTLREYSIVLFIGMN